MAGMKNPAYPPRPVMTENEDPGVPPLHAMTPAKPPTRNAKENRKPSFFENFPYYCISNYFMLNLHTYSSADQRHIKYYFLMATLAMDSFSA
jgi:hypothetical protein